MYCLRGTARENEFSEAPFAPFADHGRIPGRTVWHRQQKAGSCSSTDSRNKVRAGWGSVSSIDKARGGDLRPPQGASRRDMRKASAGGRTPGRAAREALGSPARRVFKERLAVTAGAL